MSFHNWGEKLGKKSEELMILCMKITKPFAIIQDYSYFVGQRFGGGDMEIKKSYM